MANSQYLIPRVETVKPVAKAPATLLISFAGGEKGRVDLTSLLQGKRALAALRNPVYFRHAKPADHGYGIAWDNGIEIGADTLYWLYRRQNGLWDSADEMHVWRVTNGLTLEAAAEEIGVSRRMLSYYEGRKWPVPKTVALAVAGWQARQAKLAT